MAAQNTTKSFIERRVKIVSVIGQLGRGGSERQLYLVLKNLDIRLFECHVIVFNPSRYATYDQSLRDLGVRLWRLPEPCKGIFRRTHHLNRIFREVKPDVVHSWTFHANPYAGFAGWLAKVPVRLGSLRSSLYAPNVADLPVLYRFLSLYSVSRIVINSDTIIEELRSTRFPTQRIFHIPNCVEIGHPVDQHTITMKNLTEIGISANDRIVGVVANLRRVKNHKMFLQGMAGVLQKFPDVKAMIVGQPIPTEPAISTELNETIKALGLQRKVILAGFRQDVPNLLRRFHVFCLTSSSEGTPNALLEAMVASRPIVATRAGNIPNLIDDAVNGLLVDPGDGKGLSGAVEKLLNSPELALKLGKAARATVEKRFSCKQIAIRFANLYLRALDGAKRRLPL